MKLSELIADEINYNWLDHETLDTSAAVEAIIARLHECVKPLEWYEKGSTAFAHKTYVAGIYCIEHRLNSNEAFDLWIGPDAVKATRHPTLEAAKAAANAHRAKMMMEGWNL